MAPKEPPLKKQKQAPPRRSFDPGPTQPMSPKGVADVAGSGVTSKKKPKTRKKATRKKKSTYRKKSATKKKAGRLPTGEPSPPAPPYEDVGVVADAAVRVSTVTNPWLLIPFDAIAIPTSPEGKFGNFGTRLLKNRPAHASIPRTRLSQAPMTPDRPRMNSGTTNEGPFTLYLFTSRGPNSVPTVEGAARAMMRVCELADEANVKRLVLPMVGTGVGKLNPEEVLAKWAREMSERHLHSVKQITIPHLGKDFSERARALFEELIHPLKMQVQRIDSDKVGGPDLLDVKADVDALTEATSLTEVEPPLVVGILGGWGTGKSFVLHLFEQRLREIRAVPLKKGKNGITTTEDDPFPYVGHPYIVRFDAWTYAKANLWASLMHSIFMQLDEQLDLERELEEGLKISLLHDTFAWFTLSQLSARQRREFFASPNAKAALDAVEAVAQSDEALRRVFPEIADQLVKLHGRRGALEKFRGPDVVGALWQKMLKLHQQDVEALKKARDNLRDIETEADQAHKKERNDLTKKYRHRADVQALEELQAEVTDRFRRNVISAALEEMPEEAPEDLGKFLENLSWLRRWLAQFDLSILLVILGGAALTVAPLIFEWVGVDKLFAHVAGIITFSLPLIRSFNTGVDWIRTRQATHDQRRETHLAALMRSVDDQIEQAVHDKHGQNLSDARAQVDVLEDKVGIAAKYTTVREFLRATVEKELYASRLGIMHQVQKDLQTLTDKLVLLDTDSMLEKKIKKEIFPRGDPRIFLLVDDLDRCPPERVVEVFEAAQLLVKTKLFVVLLAMDVRYVTRALESKYAGVLVRDGDPSGLDYIEKIVQIPYRVRSIDPAAVSSFLEALMQPIKKTKTVEDVAEGQDDQTDEEKQLKTDQHVGEKTEGLDVAKTTEPKRNGGEEKQKTDSSKEVDKDAGGKGPRDVLTPLPSTVVRFQETDVKLVKACFDEMDVSPRAGKRIVNVFKLLKIIWYRRRWGARPSRESQQVMLYLLSLAANHPGVMQVLLQDLEEHMRTPSGSPTFLKEYIDERCDHWVRESPIPSEWERVRNHVEATKLISDTQTLESLGSGQLRLVRSFSFVGEPGIDPRPPKSSSFPSKTSVHT